MIRFQIPSGWIPEAICQSVCEKMSLEPLIDRHPITGRWQLDTGNNAWLKREKEDVFILILRDKRAEKIEEYIETLTDLGFIPLSN